MPDFMHNYADIVGTARDTRQFEALFKNVMIGMVLTNQAGEIMLMNQFAENQFGYTSDELVGKPVELLIPHKLRKKHEGHRQDFYRHPQIRMMGEGRDLRALRKDGSEFPAEVSLSHYELEGKNYVIALIVDITHRKKQEEALFRQNEALEKKANDRTLMLQEALQALEKTDAELKMAYEKEKELGEIKSRFVSMASHEFRTPLSTILSSISLVKRYSGAEEIYNRERHISKIQNAVKTLNYILEDFLSLGKLEEGQVVANPESLTKRIFLAEIDGLLQEMNQASGKNQQIELGHSLKSELFIVDRKLLRNILANLVSNAIKYSPGNSVITIHCSDGCGDLQIAVCDKGIGISEAEQEHLFERFFRASNVAGIEGTGLG
ncbi:MAG TPA: PAS domain-containing sensor histidine kinase, partial [Cyclobacteriaceae bacterium]|nr:PAS domain-containing sensor histidine kinase [Cyclobacteriaceae bacterium]